MMNQKTRSRILTVVFGFNIFQFVIILVKPAENVSMLFAVVLAIPLLLISYNAMKLDRISFILLLYWFGLQIFLFDFGNSWNFSFNYGISFRITFFDGAFGFNPVAFLLLILTLLEVDKVFFNDEKVELTQSQLAESNIDSIPLHTSKEDN